jgi:hypothetical protein
MNDHDGHAGNGRPRPPGSTRPLNPMLLPPVAERLNRHEAAALLGVCPHTLRNYELRGYLGVRLIPYRIGGKLWYSKDLLETWCLEVERRRQTADQPPATDAEHQAALRELRAMGVDV